MAGSFPRSGVSLSLVCLYTGSLLSRVSASSPLSLLSTLIVFSPLYTLSCSGLAVHSHTLSIAVIYAKIPSGTSLQSKVICPHITNHDCSSLCIADLSLWTTRRKVVRIREQLHDMEELHSDDTTTRKGYCKSIYCSLHITERI